MGIIFGHAPHSREQGIRYVPRIKAASFAEKENVLESESFHAKDTL